MHIWIRKIIVSLLALCILVSTLCMPAGLAEGTARVQATGDANIRSAPSIDAKIIGLLPRDQEAGYLDEISIDNRGVAWYKIVHNDAEAWISAKYSKLIDAPELKEVPEETSSVGSDSPLADYPNFYDGYVFEMTGVSQLRMDDTSENGTNAAGDVVNWNLIIYQVKPGSTPGSFLNAPPPELAYCSWDDSVSEYTNDQLDLAWDSICAGETLLQHNLYYHWPGEYEIRTYETAIYLPDNREIEGPQQLIYLTDDEALVFDFELDYNGGYSGYGLGWNIDDVQLTKCSLEEYENSYT